MVPQKVTYPPEETEVQLDLTTDQMVEVGKEIVEGKGTCLACHTIGAKEPGRFPDLAGIGARAATRREGMSDVEYLAESLYEPNAYIVDGFAPGMIPPSKPPVSLTDPEILTVIAYLQSLGSTPTVNMQTKLPYASETPSSATAGATSTPSATAAASGVARGGKELFEDYACVTCHNLDSPEALVGPSLHDVGQRLTVAALYESIMEPDATISDGYTAAVMPATLNATGFYDKVTAQELKTMVDYLASLKGDQ